MAGTERPPSAPASSSRAEPRPTSAQAETLLASGSAGIPKDLVKVCPTCGVLYPREFVVCPRDAAELVEDQAAEHDPLVGQTLAHTYTLVRVLGEGGMGRVYEARHTRIKGKRFALKLLHPEFARQPEVLTRFQREAEAAAMIHSEHVVGVFDVDRTPDGRAFIVAELLEGKELGSYLEKVGKMPVGDAVRVVRQICKAMEAAHALGVVHRDMKPENVFLTGDLERPVAKVIDFGISKVSDRPGTALTKTGMIMGTPSYMAPEQARGEHVDHRADIYAVGAVLYCILTGRRPFDHADPTVTLTTLLTSDPPRPRSLEASIPEPLEMIIQKAMAKHPEDRHASMAELDLELAAYEPAGDSPWSLGATEVGWTRSSGAGVVRLSGIESRTRTVAMARPMIVLLGALGLFWVGGSLILAITGIVRLAKGGGARANLDIVDAVLLTLGVLFTLLTPVILAGRHVAKNVWDNSMKAVVLASRVRVPVLAGLSAYGFATLLVRLLESVLLRHAVGVAWPAWDLLLFAIGGVAAGGAYAVEAAHAGKRS